MSTITEQDIFLVQKEILISLIENYNNHNNNLRISRELIDLTDVSSKMTQYILDSSLVHYKKFIKPQELLLEKNNAE